MFGLNETTQFYVCQRYVRMNLDINGMTLKSNLTLLNINISKKSSCA